MIVVVIFSSSCRNSSNRSNCTKIVSNRNSYERTNLHSTAGISECGHSPSARRDFLFELRHPYFGRTHHKPR